MDAHIRSDGDDDEPVESGTMAEQCETIGDRREGRPTLHWREDPGEDFRVVDNSHSRCIKL